MIWPNEHDGHAMSIKGPATIVAFSTALAGVLLATIFYCWRILSPEDVRQQFSGIYSLLRNKWWFDELYDWMFVKPTHVISQIASAFDRHVIDVFLNGLVAVVRKIANIGEAVLDRGIVDGSVNTLAEVTYSVRSSCGGRDGTNSTIRVVHCRGVNRGIYFC